MYSWDGGTDGWYGARKYSYDDKTAEARAKEASRAKAAGPRSYGGKSGPNTKVVDPRKQVSSTSKHPVIIAVDVTGSMASWPAEIFDRLPLLFTTLAQYRDDLEICFAAIGDARVDRFPLQVTTFASGFDLEQQLGSLYGEGGGGDAPESYGLFAHWVDTHVQTPNAADKPFLIVFGDITMHPTVLGKDIEGVLGDGSQDVDAATAWRRVASKWETWFLRRPGGKTGDRVDQQWADAIGADRILHIDDEQRAVDYAMGLIARAWGFFGDFQENMLARQDEGKVKSVSERLRTHGPRPLKCPACGAPIPVDAAARYSCTYCATTVVL